MKPIIITCNRCRKTIEGYDGDFFTVGFYRMNGYWKQFAKNENEEIVCDECMNGDPQYKSIYINPLSKEGVTEDDVNRAQELIKEHGWDV